MSVSRWQTLVTLGAAVGVGLVLTNMILFIQNQALRDDVSSRAQYIQQTVQLGGIHREIVNAIANLAVRNKDDALKTILTQQGIIVNPGQPQPMVAPPSAPAPEAKGRR